jgi:hypothetical protein
LSMSPPLLITFGLFFILRLAISVLW